MLGDKKKESKTLYFIHEISGSMLTLYERRDLVCEEGKARNVLSFLAQISYDGNLDKAMRDALMKAPVDFTTSDFFQSYDFNSGKVIYEPIEHFFRNVDEREDS